MQYKRFKNILETYLNHLQYNRFKTICRTNILNINVSKMFLKKIFIIETFGGISCVAKCCITVIYGRHFNFLNYHFLFFNKHISAGNLLFIFQNLNRINFYTFYWFQYKVCPILFCSVLVCWSPRLIPSPLLSEAYTALTCISPTYALIPGGGGALLF